MKAIEINSTTDGTGKLQLSYNLKKCNKNVRVIILYDDKDQEISENEWLKAASRNPSFDFLNEPEEDIYTLNDGEPLND